MVERCRETVSHPQKSLTGHHHTASFQETKENEDHEKKEAEKVEKERNRSAFNNPTLLGIVTPPKPSPKGASLSAPISPTPGALGLRFSLPPGLVPSPLRPDSHNGSPSRSPSHEPPPLHVLPTRVHLMFPARSSLICFTFLGLYTALCMIYSNDLSFSPIVARLYF